jgi:hypothetical protein
VEQQPTTQEVRKGFIAFIFSLLATAIVGAAVTFIHSSNLALATDVKLSFFQREFDRLKSEVDSFHKAGGRFTSEDGARHDTRLDELEKFKQVCGDRTLRLELEHEHIKSEQEKLCARVNACANNSNSKR